MVLTAHQDTNGTNSFGLFGTSFDDRRQNKVDLEWSKAFNEAISSGMNIGEAKNAALAKFGRQIEDISEDVVALADKSTKAGIKIKDLGLKAKAASIGMKALSIAANAALTIFASWAIGKAIEYIDSLVHAQDRLEEKLADAKGKYQESEAAVESLNDRLKSTQEQIEAIKAKGAFITPIEQAELDKLKETVEELNRLRDIQEDIAEKNKKDLVQAAFEAYEGSTDRLFGRAGKNNETMFVSESDALLDAAKISPESFKDITGNYDSYSSEAGYADYLRNGAVLDLQQASEAYIVAYRIAKEERMKALEAGDEDLAQAWADNAGEANSYFAELYQWYEAQLSGLSRIEGENLTTQQKVVNQMFDDMDVVGLFFSESSGRNVLEAQFDQVKKQYSEEFKSLEAYIKENGSIDEAVFAQMFSGIATAFEKYNWKLPDVVAQVNATYAPATAPSSPSPTSYDQVTASTWRATEAYTALTEAMEAQNEAGYLSAEAYNALIEADAEYIELLELTAEGYKINEEALWKYIEAQDDLEKGKAIKAMMELQDAMLKTEDVQEKMAYQSQIDNLSAYINQLDRATGALARFRAAQETPNQDEEFGEGQKAFDVIKEGRKTGKVGTDDFKESVGLMLGDNWETEYAGQLDKAYKKAEQIGKRYFGQKDERQGMANFRDDLVKANLGEFDGKTFTLFEGVTLEETAKQLGTSVDAVKSMFGLMQAYGGDFEFPFVLTTEDIQNVEKYKDSLSQKELESGISQLSEKAEELTTQLGSINPEVDPTGYSNLQQEIEQVTAAKQVLNDELNERTEVELDTLTLDQLYEKLTQLETVVTTLEGLGITVPVDITGEVDTVKELINQKEFEKFGTVNVSTDETSYATTQSELDTVADDRTANYIASVDPTKKQEAINALDDISKERTITIKVDVDNDGVEEELTQKEFIVGVQSGQIDTSNVQAPEPITVDVDADTTPVSTELDSLIAEFAENNPEILVDLDSSAAQAKLDAFVADLIAEKSKSLNLNTSAAEGALALLEKDLKATVVKRVQIITTGNAAYASGTDSAAGGMSLVDERGAELIEHTSRGTYELGTNSGPRFTNLDPGDVVHTASETKKIMSRMAKVGGFFRDGLNKGKAIIGKAFATGVSGSMSWDLINQVFSSSSGSSKKNSSSSKSSTKTKNWKTYVEKLFDWIEIRLDRLQTQTDKWILAASEAIGYAAKNSELDKALSSTSQQIDETTQAYQRYLEQAQTIASKAKLSAGIVQSIQEGAIDIASYDKTTQEKIKAYQEWWITPPYVVIRMKNLFNCWKTFRAMFTTA